MLYLGINTFIQPETAISGFGLPLYNQADVPIILIKADRDLFIGVISAALWLLRMRRAILVTMFFGAGMPIIDACLVLTNPATQKIDSWVHIAAVILMLVVSWVLYREERKTSRNHRQNFTEHRRA